MGLFDPQKRAAEINWWRHWFESLGGEDGFIAQRRDDLRNRTEFFPQALHETGLGLDLGCGLVSIFEFTDLNLVAADPLVEEFQKIYQYPGSRVPYVQTGYGALPFADGDFDYVFCLNVIDHTPDPQLLVDEIYRVLKPGGRLYLHIYFDRELTAPHYALWRPETVEQHLAQFSLCEQHYRIEKGGRASYFARFERPQPDPQSALAAQTVDQEAARPIRPKSANRVMLIPRIFHRVWLGSAPMPEELVAYGESWLQNHPGWEMRLWTDGDLPKLINEDVFRQCRTYSEKSDVIRYELLFQYGGVYLDTDVECRKNIEPLLAGVSSFAALEEWGVVGTAIVGGAIGHPLFLEIIRGAAESFRTHEGDPVWSMGPKYLSHCVFDFLDRNPGEVFIFDRCFFYPYGHWEKHRREEPCPWAFAVHHWLGSWCR